MRNVLYAEWVKEINWAEKRCLLMLWARQRWQTKSHEARFHSRLAFFAQLQRFYYLPLLVGLHGIADTTYITKVGQWRKDVCTIKFTVTINFNMANWILQSTPITRILANSVQLWLELFFVSLPSSSYWRSSVFETAWEVFFFFETVCCVIVAYYSIRDQIYQTSPSTIVLFPLPLR